MLCFCAGWSVPNIHRFYNNAYNHVCNNSDIIVFLGIRHFDRDYYPNRSENCQRNYRLHFEVQQNHKATANYQSFQHWENVEFLCELIVLKALSILSKVIWPDYEEDKVDDIKSNQDKRSCNAADSPKTLTAFNAIHDFESERSEQ